MKRLMVKLAGAVTFAAATAVLPVSLAAAAEWPSDTVKLIVPYSPGGTTDIISRKVADLLKDELGNVIVENRPGAGSTVGTGQLARGGRGADHSILMASPGHAIGAAIYSGLRYAPVNDFRFIRNVITIPNVMVVPADSPYNSVAEFIDGARGGELTFSSPGVGSSVHMSAELFKNLTDTNMVHVPFRGSGEALPALLGGDVDVAFENMPTVLPHIKSGKLKALAVTTTKRSPFLPDVPTVAEVGIDYGLGGYKTSAWFGLIAHKSMPDEAVSKLRDAMTKIMGRESFTSFLPQIGAEPGEEDGEVFRDFVAEEVTKWAEVAQHANIKN
uniref:Bug family tripartite tricarboxylate transporter substrate binding protein n=1 Tax=Marinobacterium profundum TaxID=1714300 RepID=UPI000AB4BE84|nr:tripartite tricarboxylate transporter substrate-binding protein [Marinobacterium profundum]